MSRTYRLRRLPSLHGEKFVEGCLRKFDDNYDEKLYGKLAHEWYDFPCIKNTTQRFWSYRWQRWLTRECSSHELCLTTGLEGIDSSSMGPWKYFRLMKNRTPPPIACIWNHPWVGMHAGGGRKKYYRIRNNRDFRRKVKEAEQRAMDDEEMVFPIYKKEVLWQMW